MSKLNFVAIFNNSCSVFFFFLLLIWKLCMRNINFGGAFGIWPGSRPFELSIANENEIKKFSFHVIFQPHQNHFSKINKKNFLLTFLSTWKFGMLCILVI